MSSTGSIRKSLGNILTKIKSRPSVDGVGEDSKPGKASDTPCCICGAKSKKNFMCRTCSKVVCLSDSGVTSQGLIERTCDNCIHLNLVNELSCSDATKDKISGEIQELVSKRDACTKMLNRESARIKNLQNELKEAAERLETEKVKNEAAILGLQKNTRKMEEDIEAWNVENSKRKALQEHDEKTTREITKETEHYRIALDEMVKERTTLLSQLNELRDFIRLQVPVRLIKRIVCSSCYITVTHSLECSSRSYLSKLSLM